MMGDSTLCTCKPGLFQLFLHRRLEHFCRQQNSKFWSGKPPEFYNMTCAENIRYSSLRHVRSLGFSVAANAALLPPPLAVLPFPPSDFPFVLTTRCACSRTQTSQNTSSTAQCNMQLTWEDINCSGSWRYGGFTSLQLLQHHLTRAIRGASSIGRRFVETSEERALADWNGAWKWRNSEAIGVRM